jgi:transposase
MKKRRKFTSEFKSKVALEALREQQPIHEIAKRYQIHPTAGDGMEESVVV